MKKVAFIFVVCLMQYVQSVPTDSEVVWLKDVTSNFMIDKRIHGSDLPDELIFHLRRGSGVLILNLKRNHGIDPNADIYFVRKLKDGQSLLEKSQNLEMEDLAYYKDMKNGAFVTVRCVKRSNGQCDRIITGNIRLGNIYYDLRPANTVSTAINLLDAPDGLGTRYVLQEQAGNLAQQLTYLFRGNISSLPNRETTGKRNNKPEVYWVKMAVLIDFLVWELFYSLTESDNVHVTNDLATRKIKEFFSHVINGVSLLYDNIEKRQIEINIILHHFYIFKTIEAFPNRYSTVRVRNGIENIQVDEYLSDISYWDINVGSKSGVVYDHAMMFTRFDLYDESIGHNTIRGRSPQSKVCDIGRRISVVESRDFFVTVLTAAHELGHSLGAVHDGQGDAISCPAKDLFIMTTETPDFDPEKPYSRNPWLFSKCSVNAFRKLLKMKTCVQNLGTFFNWNEWSNYMVQKPGEAYSLDKQCQFIHGPLSKFCQDEPADICLNVQCTDPKTGKCLDDLYNAARGTRCGNNMWCIEGRCVSKRSK